MQQCPAVESTHREYAAKLETRDKPVLRVIRPNGFDRGQGAQKPGHEAPDFLVHGLV